MTLGQRLHLLIEERGITQKQLAGELNMAASTLGGYMQDTSEPDFSTLKLLASYFDVSTDYLLDYSCNNQYDNRTKELLRIFSSLSSEQKDLYLEQGKAFLKFNLKREQKLLKSTSNHNHAI